MIIKAQENKCFQCNCDINKTKDLYYLFVLYFKKQNCLSICDKCFHSGADTKIKEHLSALSYGDPVTHWRDCPYCDERLPYSEQKAHFMISELFGSNCTNMLLHYKCYYRNIGIEEEYFYEG